MAFDVSKFLRGVGEGRRRAMAAAARSVEVFGNHVIGKAQEITPVKTGALQNSGTVETPVTTRSSVECTIGFNTDYAAAVHERLNAHHAQGQPKYLETAMRQEARKLVPFVRAEVDKALQ